MSKTSTTIYELARARERRHNSKIWNFQSRELLIQLRNNHNLKLRYWTFRSIHIHSVLSIDSPRLDDSVNCLKVEPLKFIEFQIDMPKNKHSHIQRARLTAISMQIVCLARESLKCHHKSCQSSSTAVSSHSRLTVTQAWQEASLNAQRKTQSCDWISQPKKTSHRLRSQPNYQLVHGCKVSINF